MSAPEPLILATAIESALRAGRRMIARLNTPIRVDKKGAIDLVTEVDLAIEREVRALIAQRFPDHAILGEEFAVAADAARHGGYCWVFDPIDGTTNYAHRLPIFCVSLAVEREGRTEVGVVYDPTRQELFTAERDGGAFLNGAPIHVSAASQLLDAMLCTGFPYDVHESVDEVVGLFGAFVGRAQAVRRLGSAAIDLCYVACGRLDGFWEQRLKPWDTAAGALIVREAGGRVTGFDGSPFDSRRGEIVASNDVLHPLLANTIAEWGARRSRNKTD